MSAALVLWSGFTALCGVAGSFPQIFLARMGVGVGEAVSQPASTALISDLFPLKQRTSAMSILLAGAPVGGLLGLMVGGYVGSLWGWRTAFVVAGIPGLIVSTALFLSVRDPRVKSLANPTATASFLDTVRLLGRNPRFIWLVTALTCVSFLPYASGAWLPPFFIRVHGMNTAQLGKYAGLAVGFGGGIGTLGCGFLCDLLRARMRHVELKVIAWALGLGCLFLTVTLFIPSLPIALMSMFLFFACAYAFLGPMVTLIQRESQPESRALAIAIGVTVSNILNLTVAVPLVGFISDVLKGTYGPQSIKYALELGSIIASAVGLLGLWKASKPDSLN